MNVHPQTGVSLRSPSSISMTAPPTQNTAPVLEYRCLYTHDIRRKAKRWQDGLLRFHTFNKRVMVYDFPARNYIGDTHWREDCPVQDGDELQLDRPVLVQVCDQIASVEQDLTELLESRKRKHAVAEEAASRRALPDPRPNQHGPQGTGAARLSPPTPLQPKSLNALLGISASRPGKAALPAKSPYDIREDSEPSRIRGKRPLKKARLENNASLRSREDSQNDISTVQQAVWEESHRRRARLSSGERASGHHEQPVGRTKVTTSTAPSFNPATATGMRASPHTPLANATESGDDGVQHGSSKNRVKKPRNRLNVSENQIHRTPSRRQTSPRLNLGPTEESCDSTRKSSSPPPMVANHQTAKNHQLQKPRSKLQMASHKPRRKLMYRDLLPPDESGTACESPETARRSSTTVRTRARKSAIDNIGNAASPPEDESHAEAHPPDNISRLSPLSDDNTANLGPRILANRPTDVARESDQSGTNEKTKGTTVTNRNDSETSLANHDTSKSIEMVDEILASQNFGSKASRLTRLQTPNHLQTDRDPSPLILVAESPPLLEATVGSDHYEDRMKSPILISSPELVEDVAKSFDHAHEGAAGNDPNIDISGNAESPILEKDKSTDLGGADKPPADIGESLTNASPVRPRRQAAATSMAGGPPTLRNATSLPSFVPVRPTRRTRSPLKVSLSENSVDAIDARREQGAQSSHSGPSRALVAEPWSREAWDLFGCARDGVEVSYGDFCRQEHVV